MTKLDEAITRAEKASTDGSEEQAQLALWLRELRDRRAEDEAASEDGSKGALPEGHWGTIRRLPPPGTLEIPENATIHPVPGLRAFLTKAMTGKL